ncbi:MAG: threonine aldolase family protein [Acidimicrobiia bacterium]
MPGTPPRERFADPEGNLSMSQLLNLRSDTQTLPTEAMLEAMSAAELGDDTYREDPTVIRLEERVAEMLAREASMLVLSGTMANLVSLMVHCRPGDEFFVDAQAHVIRSEAGGYAGVAGVAPVFVEGRRGHPAPEALRAGIHDPDVHRPHPRLLWLENTHNRAGGTVMGIEHQRSLVEIARDSGLATHLDGARIFNAAIALGLPVDHLADGADTVYVDLTKGLSCPMGALVAGDLSFIEEARNKRRALGGGMRQAGIIAAAGLVALETMVDRLEDDHALARWLAERLAEIDGYDVDVDAVETNIVFADVSRLGGSQLVAERLLAKGLIVLGSPPSEIRMVTHRHIGRPEAETALRLLAGLAEETRR